MFRAKITSTALVHQGLVEVHFIDYGNRDYLPFLQTRLMHESVPALKHIMTIPPQAKEFILGSVTHYGATWDEQILALINSEIRYVELQYQILNEVGLYKVIRLLTVNNDDVAMNFVMRKMVQSLSPYTQNMMLLSYSKRIEEQQQMVVAAQPAPPPRSLTATSPPSQVVSTPTLLNYKSLTLEPGSEHAVFVSYVADGPLHFSVQLKRLEDTLAKLMNELDRMQLQPFEEMVIPGTVCVSRCIEDGYFCRAVVTSTVDSQYKVRIYRKMFFTNVHHHGIRIYNKKHKSHHIKKKITFLSSFSLMMKTIKTNIN